MRVADAVDVLAETYGTYLLADSAAALKPSNEALAGIKVFVEKSSYLMIGAGPRYTSGFEAADLRGVIGFIFEPPIGDRDGDHVLDDEDDCPTRDRYAVLGVSDGIIVAAANSLDADAASRLFFYATRTWSERDLHDSIAMGGRACVVAHKPERA